MKRMLSVVLCMLMIAGLCIGCTNSLANSKTPAAGADSTDASEPYYIGLSIPLSGSAALGGNYQLWASQYAADQINAEGGINGRKIELVAIDDAEDVSQAPIVAQKFCDDEKIVAVIAHSASSLTAATQPIFEAAGMPNLSSCSTVSKLSTYGYDYWLRTCVGNNSLCPSIAAFAKNNLKCSKIAIVYDNGDNGVTMKDSVIETCNKLGGMEIVAKEAYNTGIESDFSTIITKVKNSSTDCLVFQGNYTDGGAFLRQMYDLGLDIPIVSLSWLTYNTTIKLAGAEACKNLYCCVAPSPFGESKQKQEFLAAFQKEFGEDVIPTTPCLLNYDCVYAIAQALEEGATKENLAQWIKNYPGLHDGRKFVLKGLNLCDEYSIAENGDVAQYVVSVIGVKDGKFYGWGSVDMTGLQ